MVKGRDVQVEFTQVVLFFSHFEGIQEPKRYHRYSSLGGKALQSTRHCHERRSIEPDHPSKVVLPHLPPVCLTGDSKLR